MDDAQQADQPSATMPETGTLTGDEPAEAAENMPPPEVPEGVEARGERYLARVLAPPAGVIRHMRYFSKWIVLGGLIGIVAGLGAIVFYSAIGLCTRLFQGGIAGYIPPSPAGEGRAVLIPPTHFWLFPVATTLGGLLAGFLVVAFAPEAEGHGTDAAIATFHDRAGIMRPRTPLIKLVASAITLGSGGSGGREGPTAQISAGFGSFLGRLLKLEVQDRRIAVATGIGSGIAAIFRAPLGGAVLAAELLYRRDFETDALVPAFVASIVGYTLFSAVFGWVPVFGNQPGLVFSDPIQLLYYAILGVVVGLIGIVYIKLFYGTQHLFARLPLSPYLKPALGGLLVGLIGLGVPAATGVGYGWVQFLMQPNEAAIPLLIILILPLLKIITTSLSIGSGGSGGIFGPGLVIGAGVGASSWHLLHHVLPGMPLSPAPFVVVAMMSLFGAVAHAPIAMMLMVGEMTGSYGLLAPAMITVSIASLVVGDRTIYTSQPATRADSPAHRLGYAFPLLRALYVRDAMQPPVLVLPLEMGLAEAQARMVAADVAEAAVAEPDGTLVGLLTQGAVARAAGTENVTAGKAAIPTLSIESDETLDAALTMLAENRVQRLPVVHSNRPLCLAGVITMQGITKAYATHLTGDMGRMAETAADTQTMRLIVTDGSPAAGRMIKDLKLPADALIVSLEREGATLIPRGSTVLRAGDAATVLTSRAGAPCMEALLQG